MTMLDPIRIKIDTQEDLNIDELMWLLNCADSAEQENIYTLADEINLRLNGREVSFVHNMNINYTNYCEEVCTFCAFRKNQDDPEAYILSLKDILERIDGLPIAEITFQGGLTQKVSFESVLEMIEGIKKARPEIHLHTFSPEEVRHYAQQEHLSYERVLQMAKKAGMDSMCGTAAEILDDEVRRKICPQKVTTQEWLDIVKTAHRLGLPSTATILFGHIEKARHIANHLLAIRALQKETGKLTEFIPLLFIPDQTLLGKSIRRNGSPYGSWAKGYEVTADRVQLGFRLIAISRIWFHNHIRNIQTSWVKLGFKNALKSLSLGANDMSGTLYSENITREAGGQNGEYVPLQHFYEAVRSIGKIPIERDTLYHYQQNSSCSQMQSVSQS